MPESDDRRQLLAAQEERLQFDRFGHEEAWDLGCRLVSMARDRGHPVVVGVDLGEQAVFRAGLPGSSPDNDRWLERKFATVRRFLKCSAAMSGLGAGFDVYEVFALDRGAYALTGGAFPIRVQGTLVGTVGASGLSSDQDHDLVVEALVAMLGGDA